jgi:hypothetical protein
MPQPDVRRHDPRAGTDTRTLPIPSFIPVRTRSLY